MAQVLRVTVYSICSSLEPFPNSLRTLIQVIFCMLSDIRTKPPSHPRRKTAFENRNSNRPTTVCIEYTGISSFPVSLILLRAHREEWKICRSHRFQLLRRCRSESKVETPECRRRQALIDYHHRFPSGLSLVPCLLRRRDVYCVARRTPLVTRISSFSFALSARR